MSVLTNSPKIVTIVGTRPEIIKTAPVVLEFARREVPFAVVHTGQHYTPSLDAIFFRELGLPPVAINVEAGSLAAPQQLAKMIASIADALDALRADVVLVQGDTNTVLAGALAAHKKGIPIAHLEAGLRSDDWTMPEEGNRAVVGRLASVHFCPTQVQVERLAQEGIVRGIYVVGNTAVDACLLFAERARTTSRLRARLELDDAPYALLTMHRPSNVDDPARLAQVVDGLDHVARALGTTFVFPIHPRTEAAARAAGLLARLERPPFRLLEPIGYLDLLDVLRAAAFVLTDSGGLQEEACTLRVPCVTLRPNTERPETVAVGANVLCRHADGESMARAIRMVTTSPRDYVNPLGDGQTAKRVVDVLTSKETRWAPSGHP